MLTNKSTLKLSIKCFLNSLFLILISASLFMPFSLIGGGKADIYFGVTMLVIYCIFFYQICWKIGWDDIGKVKRGVVKQNLLRGFLACFIGTLPATVPLVVRIFNQDLVFFNLLNSVINFGFGGYAFNDKDTYILLVYFVLILVSGAAYILGYKEVSLYRVLVYTKKKEK